MREIKFRAWDKNRKKIFPVRAIIFGRGKVQMQISETDVWPEGTWVVEDLKNVELVEYTGMKDANGVEIHEGYVVEQSFTELGATEGLFNNPPDDMTSFIGEIKMYEGRWWIDSGSWAIPLFSELNQNEVVGNIYENPELLEEEEI
jgi:uncharacterized phage protein (TIGR01671 family)